MIQPSLPWLISVGVARHLRRPSVVLHCGVGLFQQLQLGGPFQRYFERGRPAHGRTGVIRCGLRLRSVIDETLPLEETRAP